MAGAVCYPVCVVPLSDPVVLPRNSTADTLKHWIIPTRVQVKKLLFEICMFLVIYITFYENFFFFFLVILF